MKKINMPSLEIIGGSLILIGQKNINQDSFPKLKKVGGDMHLGQSGLTKLPDSLEFVGGNVFLIPEPKSLVNDCLEKKKRGIIKGNIFLVGGAIKTMEDGAIDYEQKILI